jgi:hypothetical protein
MSGRDVIRMLFSFLERGQGKEAERHLSGDFLLSGWNPQPYSNPAPQIDPSSSSRTDIRSP